MVDYDNVLVVQHDNVLVVSDDMMEYWCCANIPPRPLVDLKRRTREMRAGKRKKILDQSEKKKKS